MSSVPPDDPLIALWQTAPKPDAQHLLQDLQRLNRLHRRFNWSIFLLMSGISLVIMFEEATKRVSTHGALSAVWVLSLMAVAVWHRRARCNRSVTLTLDTVSLLKSTIARAKRDLFLARCLYAGVPCGALLAFLALKFASIDAQARPVAIDVRLHRIQTGAGVAALIAMTVTGAILARSRRLQVDELTEKLKSLQGEL